MTTPGLPKSLLDAARNHTLVPFAGAGVSRAVKRSAEQVSDAFPTWKGLLESAAVRLREEGRDDYANVVSSLLNLPGADYLDVARRAQQGLGPLWFDFLRRNFKISKEAVDDSTLALARAIWQLGSKLVITTNYDRVLTWACPQIDDLEHWRIQSVSGHVELLADRLEHPILWQLHGSVDDVTRLVLTPNGYHELYTDDDANQQYRAALETLRHVMVAKHLLFVGFSFDDPYIARQVDWVHETFAGCGGPHYILTCKSEFGRMRERLSGSVISPIMYEDHGEPLLKLLAEITVVEPRPPSEQPVQPPTVDDPPPPKRGKRRKQTRREFLAACPDGVASFFDELIDDTIRRGHSVAWGELGFSIGVNVEGTRFSLFYGWPPGYGGVDQPALWAYLPRALPPDLWAWGWKQYEEAAPFENGGKFTLKLALDDSTLEAARRSVDVLWRVAERLLTQD